MNLAPAGPLLDVPGLRGLGVPGGVTLLDVRWRLGQPDGHADYLAGHLPGAVYVDLETALAEPGGPTGGRHPLPSVARFEAAMRRAGVDADRPVVVYDDAGGTSAARCWWLLRHHGHPDVRVLDGGLTAWRSAGLPLETGPLSPRPGSWTADSGRLPVLDATTAAGTARSGILLDARTAERFRGEAEPVDPVAGHLPGARNVPAASLSGPDGRLAAPDRLRSLFSAIGVRPGVPVGCSCGSGVTATFLVLALEVAGLGPAGLYAGSWSDWVSDRSRPVALGP